MTSIYFELDGLPIGKARARVVAQAGRVRAYTPKRTAQYEEAIAIVAKGAMRGNKPFASAVSMRITLHMPVPISWSKKDRALALDGRMPHTSKPDCSNVQKSVEDALNGIVYVDDSQIVDVRVVKQYSSRSRMCVAVEQVGL